MNILPAVIMRMPTILNCTRLFWIFLQIYPVSLGHNFHSTPLPTLYPTSAAFPVRLYLWSCGKQSDCQRNGWVYVHEWKIFFRLFSFSYRNESKQYLTKCRMTHAIQLLSDPDNSISEIASHCIFPINTALQNHLKSTTARLREDSGNSIFMYIMPSPAQNTLSFIPDISFAYPIELYKSLEIFWKCFITFLLPEYDIAKIFQT